MSKPLQLFGKVDISASLIPDIILMNSCYFNPVSRLAGGGRGLDEGRGLESEVGE